MKAQDNGAVFLTRKITVGGARRERERANGRKGGRNRRKDKEGGGTREYSCFASVVVTPLTARHLEDVFFCSY